MGYYDPSGHSTDGCGIDKNGNSKSGNNSGELKNVYNSIKDSPNYPKGFRARNNGTTKNTVKNGESLDRLREIESGHGKRYTKTKIMYGNKISIHYFQSKSGKVFDVKVRSNWSNGG